MPFVLKQVIDHVASMSRHRGSQMLEAAELDKLRDALIESISQDEALAKEILSCFYLMVTKPEVGAINKAAVSERLYAALVPVIEKHIASISDPLVQKALLFLLEQAQTLPMPLPEQADSLEIIDTTGLLAHRFAVSYLANLMIEPLTIQKLYRSLMSGGRTKIDPSLVEPYKDVSELWTRYQGYLKSPNHGPEHPVTMAYKAECDKQESIFLQERRKQEEQEQANLAGYDFGIEMATFSEQSSPVEVSEASFQNAQMQPASTPGPAFAPALLAVDNAKPVTAPRVGRLKSFKKLFTAAHVLHSAISNSDKMLKAEHRPELAPRDKHELKWRARLAREQMPSLEDFYTHYTKKFLNQVYDTVAATVMGTPEPGSPEVPMVDIPAPGESSSARPFGLDELQDQVPELTYKQKRIPYLLAYSLTESVIAIANSEDISEDNLPMTYRRELYAGLHQVNTSVNEMIENGINLKSMLNFALGFSRLFQPDAHEKLVKYQELLFALSEMDFSKIESLDNEMLEVVEQLLDLIPESFQLLLPKKQIMDVLRSIESLNRENGSFKLAVGQVGMEKYFGEHLSRADCNTLFDAMKGSLEESAPKIVSILLKAQARKSKLPPLAFLADNINLLKPELPLDDALKVKLITAVNAVKGSQAIDNILNGMLDELSEVLETPGCTQKDLLAVVKSHQAQIQQEIMNKAEQEIKALVSAPLPRPMSAAKPATSVPRGSRGNNNFR